MNCDNMASRRAVFFGVLLMLAAVQSVEIQTYWYCSGHGCGYSEPNGCCSTNCCYGVDLCCDYYNNCVTCTDDPTDDDGGSSCDGGCIAGIIIGVLSFISICTAVIIYIRRCANAVKTAPTVPIAKDVVPVRAEAYPAPAPAPAPTTPWNQSQTQQSYAAQMKQGQQYMAQPPMQMMPGQGVQMQMMQPQMGQQAWMPQYQPAGAGTDPKLYGASYPMR
jgi:hypothetical protein